MDKEDAYIVGIHRYCFRAGEPAKIIGTEFVTPEDLPPRFCFLVEFEDGKRDSIPYLLDNKNYEIISESQVRSGNLPEITN